jgi:hypothetical protein
MYRRFPAFRPRATRLRVLRRGWGQFITEEVTIAGVDLGGPPESGLRTELELTEILDLDDEDSETGLPDGRERLN